MRPPRDNCISSDNTDRNIYFTLANANIFMLVCRNTTDTQKSAFLP